MRKGLWVSGWRSQDTHHTGHRDPGLPKQHFLRISTRMALAGTPGYQPQAPTQLASQPELLRTAGTRPASPVPTLPRRSLTPHFLSLQGTDLRIPARQPPTGGTYLLFLRGWTSRAGHKHGAAGASRLVLARRGEQPLTQRAPWPALQPASPHLRRGPREDLPGNRRHPAGSRLIAPGRAKPHLGFASPARVTAIGLFPLWRQGSPALLGLPGDR